MDDHDELRSMSERHRAGRPDTDRFRGLYHKFDVARTDGSSDFGRYHDGCEYFVLDLNHDQFALPIIRAYADLAEAQYLELARDLRQWCDNIEANDG